MNEEMLQALERIFDDNSGSKIESYAKFQAESRSNLSSEDQIISTEASDSDSSDGESIQETTNEVRDFYQQNSLLPSTTAQKYFQYFQ